VTFSWWKLTDLRKQLLFFNKRIFLCYPSDLPSPHIWCLPEGAAFRLTIWQTGGTQWRSLLRHCAASRKVAGSIGLNTISWHNPWPWSRLSLQQKWISGIFPGGKGGRCVRMTTLPPSCADCHEIWKPQPPGTFRACAGLYRNCITLPCDYHKPSATGWNPLVTLPPQRNHLNSDNRQVTEMISVRACKLWMVSAKSRSTCPRTSLQKERGAISSICSHSGSIPGDFVWDF